METSPHPIANAIPAFAMRRTLSPSGVCSFRRDTDRRARIPRATAGTAVRAEKKRPRTPRATDAAAFVFGTAKASERWRSFRRTFSRLRCQAPRGVPTTWKGDRPPERGRTSGAGEFGSGTSAATYAFRHRAHRSRTPFWIGAWRG